MKDGKRVLRYTEDTSKANQGGLKHKHITGKVVDAFENSTFPQRCVIRLYEIYMQHRPPNCSPFYLRPLQCPASPIWYSSQPCGRHKLSGIVSGICKQGGLPGFRSNHSLRASSATRMYDAGVDEQLICEVTGHRSNAVRNYKRTTTEQKQKISKVIQGISPQPPKVPRGEVRTPECIGNEPQSNLSITLNLNFPD